MVTATSGLLATRPRSVGAVCCAIALAVAALAGLATVARPSTVALALVAGSALAAMTFRVDWAVLLYVAVEPFGDYLGAVHPAAVKGVGALLFAAWLLRLAVDSRPVALRSPAVYAAGVLLLAVLASTVVNGGNGGAGTEIVGRYLSYLGVLVVLVDTMRSGLPARRVVAVFTASCAAAAAVGIAGFLAAGGGRAAGPLADANDFAFFLVAALPFALVLARTAVRARRVWALAALLLAVGATATFSRGALLGIAAMLAVGVLLGALRLRTVVAGVAALGVVLAVVAMLVPQVVERSLAEKEYVAAQNVDSRFASWTIAAEMTAQRPVLGYGPGGYRVHAVDMAPAGVADTTHLDVAHQMYLDVSSELGLVGLAAFLTMIGAAVASALRAARSRTADASLAVATCAAFAGCLVAATFLSEQYYLPVWLLVALAVAADRTPAPTDTSPLHSHTEGRTPPCASPSC